MQTKVVEATGKNLGRSNETTPEEQAFSEAQSMVQAHEDKLYRHTVEEAVSVGEVLPMLASDGSKKPHLIKFPCHLQPKLDGVRCVAREKDGELTLTSRGGKTYPYTEAMKEDILSAMKASGKNILDGELYLHGLPLQTIVSAVKKPNKYTDKIKFIVFDIPSDKPWKQRVEDLVALGKILYELKLTKIAIVATAMCENEGGLMANLYEYEAHGFEGVIVRNLEGKYEYNHRSKDLIKVKTMQDSEARVVDVELDKNGEGVLVCEWHQGALGEDIVRFKCKMLGTHDFRSYDNMKTKVGEYINFKYQQTSKDGVPIFPVGQYFREMDKNGNPVE